VSERKKAGRATGRALASSHNNRAVDFAIEDKSRRTASQLAAEHGFDDVVELLEQAKQTKQRRDEAAPAEQEAALKKAMAEMQVAPSRPDRMADVAEEEEDDDGDSDEE